MSVSTCRRELPTNDAARDVYKRGIGFVFVFFIVSFAAFVSSPRRLYACIPQLTHSLTCSLTHSTLFSHEEGAAVHRLTHGLLIRRVQAVPHLPLDHVQTHRVSHPLDSVIHARPITFVYSLSRRITFVCSLSRPIMFVYSTHRGPACVNRRCQPPSLVVCFKGASHHHATADCTDRVNIPQ